MQALVILPVYNEEENLGRLIPRILTLDTHLKILVVDDYSSDKSLDVARDFKERYPGRIFILCQERHLGRGDAVRKGYQFALNNSFKLLIEMDSDLSHRPEDIPLLMNTAKDVDIVIGSRLIAKGLIQGRSFTRNLITRLSNIYLKFVLDLRGIKDLTSGFRCINTAFLHRISLDTLKSKGPQLLQEIIFKNKGNIHIKEVPIVFENRYAGASKFSLSIILQSICLPLVWKIEKKLSLSF